MPDLLIKDISNPVLKSLKARAKRNGRTLQSEIKTILQGAANIEKITSILNKNKARIAGRKDPGRADLVRKNSTL